VARRHLRYVYVGNVGAERSDTLCSVCGTVLIQRVGYRVHVTGVSGDACSTCGAPSPIVGA